jgi:8-oxo-dGTP diphosphatase
MPSIEVVALAHLRDRKLLLVRSSGKKGFYLPGGKPEPGESDLAALAREIKEELACSISNVVYCTTTTAQAYAKPEGIVVHVRTYRGDLEGIPRPASEVVEIRYFCFSDYMAMPSRAPAAEILLAELFKQGLVE